MGGVFGFEMVFDFDVEIVMVFFVGVVVERVFNFFFLLDSKYIFEVEDGLFLVSVFSVWFSGEVDCFVVGGKVNVELGDKSVDEVILFGDEVEWVVKS